MLDPLVGLLMNWVKYLFSVRAINFLACSFSSAVPPATSSDSQLTWRKLKSPQRRNSAIGSGRFSSVL